MWMTGVHFQQHLFCVIRVRTSNWNALYVWTSCIEITRTKQTMKNHRSPFPGKVQGTSFVDQITVINSLPFHDTHCVWCTRRCVSDRETKTSWNLRHIVIPVLFFFAWTAPWQIEWLRRNVAMRSLQPRDPPACQCLRQICTTGEKTNN